MCLTLLGTCIKTCSIVKELNKVLIIQLLDICLRARGNKIAPVQHSCLTSLGTCAEGMQFYCPSRTYAAIPYCIIFPFLAYCRATYFILQTSILYLGEVLFSFLLLSQKKNWVEFENYVNSSWWNNNFPQWKFDRKSLNCGLYVYMYEWKNTPNSIQVSVYFDNPTKRIVCRQALPDVFVDIWQKNLRTCQKSPFFGTKCANR